MGHQRIIGTNHRLSVASDKNFFAWRLAMMNMIFGHRISNKLFKINPQRLHVYRSLIVLAALSVLIGCTNLPPAERETLIRASDMYSRGEVTSSETQLNRLIEDYSTTQEIAEAYYLRGLCRIRKGQDSDAQRDFERAIQKSKRDDLTALSRASLAALAYKQGRWTQAAGLYGKSIPHLPNKPPTDLILYCAGVSMQRIGKWKEAAYKFGRILRQFRDRPICSDARRMAGWSHEYYSIQLGAFKNADKAANTVRSYREKNLDAVQEHLPRYGGALWVVMAGRYKNYADARSDLPRVRKIQPGAFIIP
jgi:tetratricopeptide (TPR) repeat protein